MTVVRKSILTVAGTGVLAAANLGIGILLARWLSPDGLGQYALLASTATLLGTLGSMGMGGASIYFINNRGMNRGMVTTVVTRTALIIGVVLALITAIAVQYEPYFGALPPLAFLAVGLLVLGKAVIPATMYLLIAVMRVFRYVVVQTLPSLLLLALAAGLALVGQLTLGPALWAAGAGQVATVGILLLFVRTDLQWSRPFRWKELSPLLRYGVLINVSHFAYMASLDGGLFLVRLFTPAFEEVGFYQAALRLGSIVVMTVMSVGPLLFSKFAAADDATRPRHVERASRVFWLGVPGMVIVLELAARPLVLLLFGPEFEPAVLVLQIMLLGMATKALVAPILEMFYSVGAPSWVVAVLGTNVLAMAALMYMLVPAHAAVGAAVAFAVANAVALALAYTVAHARFRIRLADCFLITTQDVRFVISNLWTGGEGGG